MPSSTMFSDMDKNILEKMKNMNSNYVSSLDTFVDGFSNKIDGDDVEGFSNEIDDGDEGFSNEIDGDDVEGFSNEIDDGDEGFSNEIDDGDEGFSNEIDNGDEGFSNEDDNGDEGFSDIEGMKSKSSKTKSSNKKSSNIFKKPKKNKSIKKPKKKKKGKKKMKPIPKFDLINYLITQFGGTIKDASIFKEILTILFTAFLAFLVAHNWYSNFLTNPVYDRLDSKLSELKKNELLNAIFKYFIEIIITVDDFIMEKIHKNIAYTTEKSSFFGRRFVFYTILSFSFGVVSYFFNQIKILYDFLIKKINELIFINGDSKKLKKYFSDLGISFLKQFTINPIITSLVTILYVIFFMSAAVKENSSSLFPAALTQPTAVMIVWYIVKFAVLFVPTVMMSSTMLTIYAFYYSVINNGDKDFYSLYTKNTEHMNEKKVWFDTVLNTSLWSNFKNNIEIFFKVININFHEIFFFSTIMKLFPYIFSFPSFILKFFCGTAGIIYIYKLITSVLTKYKVGAETLSKIEKGVGEIKSNIDQIPVVEEQIKFTNMFDRIYHGYKDKIKTA